MPNCFSLARKTDPKNPVSFAEIDNELCAILGVTPDPVKFVTPHPSAPGWANWYDTIGLRLALGYPLEGTKGDKSLDMTPTEEFTEGDREFCANYNKILKHLRENYLADAWATR